MKTAIIILSVALFNAHGSTNGVIVIETQKSKEKLPPMEAAAKHEEPEELVRNLMIAVFQHDQQGVTQRILPNPDAHVLWGMSDLKDAKTMSELFLTLPITRLKIGDPLPDPFTPGSRVTPEMVTSERLVLALQTKGKDAWTFFVMRQGDEWRVDMNWLITIWKQLLKPPASHQGSKK